MGVRMVPLARLAPNSDQWNTVLALTAGTPEVHGCTLRIEKSELGYRTTGVLLRTVPRTTRYDAGRNDPECR